MDDEEEGMCKLKEENETLKEELAILKKAYAIERIIGNMREKEIEDNQSIAELCGLATEEKKRQRYMKKTGKAKPIKRKQ